MSAEPPPILPYADTTTPAGIDGVQVVVVHPDVRRIMVSPRPWPTAEGPAGSVAFEVTPYAFRMATAGLFGVSRATWPRSAVGEVRVSPVSGRLILRLAGQDPLSVDVGPDRAVAERVMHELFNALLIVPVAPPGEQEVATDPAGGLPPSPARTALFAASAALAALSLVLFAVPPHVFGCYGLILAIVPIGIALGTQRKTLWP